MEKEKKILFIGRFAPPMHGASKMNGLYFESSLVNKNFKLKKVKINCFENLQEMGKVNLKKFFGFFFVFLNLLKELIFFRPDLIYFETAVKGFAFYRDSFYVLLCKLFRKKIVFAFHGKGIKKFMGKSNFKIKYYKFIFRKTKAILLSSLLYNDVSSFLKKENVYYLGNGLIDELKKGDLEKIKKNKFNSKKLKLLYLSNMIKEKGALDVLEICDYLKNKKINFECSFVGKFDNENFEEEFNSELKRLKLEKKCFYLGPKYGEEKKDLFLNFDFLIFPTQYKTECYPVVILEAFMCGVYVYSYDNGAIKEIISKDFLGKVFPMGEFEKIAKDLIKKKSINRLKIREYFMNNFEFENAEKKLNEILLEEVNGK